MVIRDLKPTILPYMFQKIANIITLHYIWSINIHFSLQNICNTTHSTVENNYFKAFLSPHGLNIRTVKTILVGVLQWKVAQIFDALKQLFQPKKYHRPCKRSPNGEKLPDPSFTYVELCSKCFLDIYCYYKSFKKSKQRLNRNLPLEN